MTRSVPCLNIFHNNFPDLLTGWHSVAPAEPVNAPQLVRTVCSLFWIAIKLSNKYLPISRRFSVHFLLSYRSGKKLGPAGPQ